MTNGSELYYVYIEATGYYEMKETEGCAAKRDEWQTGREQEK